MNPCPNVSRIKGPKDSYDTLKVLGFGSNGCVFKVKRVSDGDILVIKTVNITGANDQMVLSLKEEIELLKKVSKYPKCNRYASCYYDSFELVLNEGVFVAILMEFIDGITFHDYLKTINKNLPEKRDEMWTYTLQTIEGLQNIHNLGVVHQDIKPDNIMIDSKTKHIRYVDFGLGCMRKNVQNPDLCFPSSAAIVFRSPETIAADENNIVRSFAVRKESDIWSLGAVLYMLWNEGKLPIGSLNEHPITILEKIMDLDFNAPSNSGYPVIDHMINDMFLVGGVREFAAVTLQIDDKPYFKKGPYRSNLKQILNYISKNPPFISSEPAVIMPAKKTPVKNPSKRAAKKAPAKKKAASNVAKAAYPSINSGKFYSFVNDEWKRYKIPAIDPDISMEKLCSITKFDIKQQQNFVADFLSPKTPYERLLLFHGLGSGKTCAAISIAERWTDKTKIITIVPASLEGNFRNELRSQCVDKNQNGKNPYLTAVERKKLTTLQPSSKEYKDIIRASDKRIDEYYIILSYEKFVRRSRANTLQFKNNVVIIDEIQNMVSKEGARYKELMRKVTADPPKRLVILSATPIFDDPVEMALTMNILLPPSRRFIIDSRVPDTSFVARYLGANELGQPILLKEDDLKNRLRGIISYYRGANPRAYPRKVDVPVLCTMSDFQTKTYITTLPSDLTAETVTKGNNFFYINSRAAANIVYPNGEFGEKGIVSSKSSMYKEANIGKFSCKLKRMLEIVNATKGPVFIYSNFVESSGARQIVDTLLANGFQDYGSGKKGPKIAVFSGSETQEYRNMVVREYNLNKNINGSLIKVVVGSPAIKEGVSLKRTRAMIMFDPYWNQSRMDQIIGRAIRYCSHADLPDKDREVKVYYLIASIKGADKNDYKGPPIIDKLLYDMSEKKKRTNDLFDTVMKGVAIDCTLFKNANQPPDIPCFTPTTDFEEDAPVAPQLNIEGLTKPNLEIRFSIGKSDKILNLSDIDPIAVYLKTNVEGRALAKRMKLYAPYNKNRETEKLAKERVRYLIKLFKEKKINISNFPVTYKPMSRGFVKFVETVPGEKIMKGDLADKVRGVKKLVIPGCPKNRRVLESGRCPDNFPFMAVNPKGYPCCYKNKTQNKTKANTKEIEELVRKHREGGEVATKKKPRATRAKKTTAKATKKNDKIYIGRKMCTGYKMSELNDIMKKNHIPLIKGRKDKVCDHIYSNSINTTLAL